MINCRVHVWKAHLCLRPSKVFVHVSHTIHVSHVLFYLNSQYNTKPFVFTFTYVHSTCISPTTEQIYEETQFSFNLRKCALSSLCLLHFCVFFCDGSPGYTTCLAYAACTNTRVPSWKILLWNSIAVLQGSPQTAWSDSQSCWAVWFHMWTLICPFGPGCMISILV